MKLIEQWKRYVGPVDERAEAESNRIYRRSFIILCAGVLLTIYYDQMLSQVAMVHQLPDQPESIASAFPSNAILMISLLVSTFYGVIAAARKGISSEHPRFETDEYPIGIYSMLSAAIGALIAFLVAGMRMIAEVQLVGVANVAWAGDIAMGIFVGLFGFGISMLFFWLVFRSARRNRERLEREQEE